MATFFFFGGGGEPIRIECGVQYTPLFGLRWMPRHCGGKQVGVGAQDMYVNYNVDRKEKRLLILWWCPCLLDILRCGFWWRVWRAEFLRQTREKGLSPDLTPYTGSRHPRGTPLDHQESRKNHLFLEGGDDSEGGKQRRLILVGAAEYNVSRLRSSCWHKGGGAIGKFLTCIIMKCTAMDVWQQEEAKKKKRPTARGDNLLFGIEQVALQQTPSWRTRRRCLLGIIADATLSLMTQRKRVEPTQTQDQKQNLKNLIGMATAQPWSTS